MPKARTSEAGTSKQQGRPGVPVTAERLSTGSQTVTDACQVQLRRLSAPETFLSLSGGQLDGNRDRVNTAGGRGDTYREPRAPNVL